MKERFDYGKYQKDNKEFTIKKLPILREVFYAAFKVDFFASIITILDYIFLSLIPIFSTYTMTRLFDEAYRYIAGENTKQKIFLFAGLYVVSYLLKDILDYISGIYINAGIFERCDDYFDLKLGYKTAKLPLISYEDSETLNQLERARECVNREVLPNIFIVALSIIANFVGVIGVLGLLGTYSLYFIPIGVISVIPYLIAKNIRGKEFYKLKWHQASKTRMINYLWGLFSKKEIIKEMKVMGFADYLTKKWENVRGEVNEELWEQSIKDSKTLFFCDTLRIAGYGLSILLTLYLTMKGSISIGLFGACIVAFQSMQNQTKEFLQGIGTMTEYFSFAYNYFDFLNKQEDMQTVAPQNLISFKGLEKEITTKNLTFFYPNSLKPALSNINITIKKGEKVVIVGENGSGKTTLSKLLLNLYPCTEGNVYYDGKDIAIIDKKDIYEKVSAIFQNFQKYCMPLRENIAISNYKDLMNNKKLQQILKEIGLDELIENIDELYGKEFGGKELSGGQWQKLAIARALFKESEIIILDEPTSALDPLLENDILTKFIEISENKTAIIISHRVGLCKLVDKIIVMKNGKIAEIGTHEQLMRKKNEYYRLYIAQEKWYA